MLLEVQNKEKDHSLTLYVYSEINSAIIRYLPFTTKAMFWKEELYFETPVKLGESIRKLRSAITIDYGKLYYWPPGKAFCIFYGVSEPYTKVYDIGFLVSNPHYSLAFEDGDELEVREHKLGEEFREEASILKKHDFTVSTPLQAGDRVLAACKFIDNTYLSVNVYKEDYGYHIESSPILEYDGLYTTIKLIKHIKSTMRNLYKYSRLDLSEEGYIVITAIADNIEELNKALGEIQRAYIHVYKVLLQ